MRIDSRLGMQAYSQQLRQARQAESSRPVKPVEPVRPAKSQEKEARQGQKQERSQQDGPIKVTRTKMGLRLGKLGVEYSTEQVDVDATFLENASSAQFSLELAKELAKARSQKFPHAQPTPQQPAAKASSPQETKPKKPQTFSQRRLEQAVSAYQNQAHAPLDDIPPGQVPPVPQSSRSLGLV